jgi:hypothetical protein
MKRNDDKYIKLLTALLMVAILAACISVRYVVLRYAPCSMFTVAEAPVRCVK